MDVKDESLGRGSSATGYHANLIGVCSEPVLLLIANDQKIEWLKTNLPNLCFPASFPFTNTEYLK